MRNSSRSASRRPACRSRKFSIMPPQPGTLTTTNTSVTPGCNLSRANELTNAYFGGVVEDRDGQLFVAATEYHSPALAAGLAAGDEIKSLAGAKVDAAGLNAAVAAAKPGDTLKLVLARAGQEREVEVVLTHKMQRSYRILPIEHPDPLQVAILEGWGGSK